VIARGAKPDGSAWQIGIQHPRREGALIGAVSVVDQAVVTSGDYQRFTIDKQGRRCHHILDLGTGYPSTSGLIGVSLVADSSFLADALSTVVFNLGLEEGMRLLADFPGTEAVLVSSDLKVFITQGLESRFQSAEQIEVNKFSK
jgi:thiamine biosynthesis lipoprotein